MRGVSDSTKGTVTAGAGAARLALEGMLSRARALASSFESEDRLRFARTFVFTAISAYWREHQLVLADGMQLRELPSGFEIETIGEDAGEQADRVGAEIAELDVEHAAYAVGMLYTGMLPGRLRTKLGAYYTPPALSERLLEMATETGVDWSSARVLDPACGGGAFLAPVARRMAESLKDCSAGTALTSIGNRLRGFEVDPFAAWMSQVFLDVTLGDLYRETGARLPSVAHACDALEQTPRDDGFDLVVGNPPYSRVRLTPDMREKFGRSLYGHANLYGVFTDLALRFARPGGVIAYVTPTSFLAGQYFKALRGLLGREAPPANIDFVGERKGVFADVLQETLLATYRRGGGPCTALVHFLSPGPDGSITGTDSGTFDMPTDPQQPWLMPRTGAQGALARRAGGLPFRLADYGYAVSTGPLVWNRHRSSLRERPGKGRYPLVWAESVRSDGVFEFRAEKRNHMPYFKPTARERWVVTDRPCVLLQRTTAKEQSRRLVAAELPTAFIEKHRAVVVENHLNMIRPANGVAPKISPSALAALLNSDVVDQIFRCINGSVAVSAYELEALPLPAPSDLGEVERLVSDGAGRETLERAVEHLFANGAG